MAKLYVQHVANIIVICCGGYLVHHWGNTSFQDVEVYTFFKIILALGILSIGVISSVNSGEAIDDARDQIKRPT